MKLQNELIYNYTEKLYQEIISNQELKFPAKINYSIQKNFKLLMSIYQEIAEEKEKICKEYSTNFKSGVYAFEDTEKREKAMEELTGLMSIEQELNLIILQLEDLGNLDLTFSQMDALMFMIEEE